MSITLKISKYKKQKYYAFSEIYYPNLRPIGDDGEGWMRITEAPKDDIEIIKDFFAYLNQSEEKFLKFQMDIKETFGLDINKDTDFKSVGIDVGVKNYTYEGEDYDCVYECGSIVITSFFVNFSKDKNTLTYGAISLEDPDSENPCDILKKTIKDKFGTYKTGKTKFHYENKENM